MSWTSPGMFLPVRAILEQQAQGILIEFQHMPDSWSWQKSVNWNTQDCLGRSEPFYSYGSSGPATMSVQLRFVAISDVHKDVYDKVAKCKALQYPTKGRGVEGACRLIVGDFIKFRGVATSVQATYNAPYETDGSLGSYKPFMAEVTIELSEAHDTPLQTIDVFKGGW